MKQKKMQKITKLVTGQTDPVKAFKGAGKEFSIDSLFTGKIRFADLPLIECTEENRRAVRYAESEAHLTPDQATEMIEADFISFSFLGAMMGADIENKKIYSYGKIGKG